MEQKKSRDNSYDVAKGLCMILVVFGHAERGLSVSGAPPQFSLLGFVDYTIYTFHMPFFFFVSGLFSHPAKQRSPRISSVSWEKISLIPICSGRSCTAASWLPWVVSASPIRSLILPEPSKSCGIQSVPSGFSTHCFSASSHPLR